MAVLITATLATVSCPPTSTVPTVDIVLATRLLVLVVDVLIFIVEIEGAIILPTVRVPVDNVFTFIVFARMVLVDTVFVEMVDVRMVFVDIVFVEMVDAVSRPITFTVE